jgi:hypothetical protein
MVASQKLAKGDSVNVVVCWWLCFKSKVKVSRGINLPSPMGSNLHLISYVGCLHILQIDSAGTNSLTEGGARQYYSYTSIPIAPPYQWRRLYVPYQWRRLRTNGGAVSTNKGGFDIC